MDDACCQEADLAMEDIENLGVGTDIESIGRFRKLDYSENNSLLNKVFTQNELAYCFSKEKAAPHLAARYAGKEAVVKALASIGKANLSYKEIEISNDKTGVPRVRINGTDFHNLRVYLSLSHCKDKAIAFAIAMEVNRSKED